MNPIEAYKALPLEQRSLVGKLEIQIDAAEQYLSALIAMLPDKEMVLNVLVDKYAESIHAQIEAKEELKQAGFSEETIMFLCAGYYNYWKEEKLE